MFEFKKTTRRNVMVLANKFVKNGMNRSEAMKKAWQIVKSDAVKTQVAGTAIVPIRQKALQHLTRYNASEITFELKAEPDNAYDENAVAVYVTVCNKGSFQIGYLPRTIAPTYSEILLLGGVPSVSGFVVGGGLGYNYGCTIEIEFNP